MKTERKVLIDGVLYPVILSDEQETLLAAKAAGRVFVGLAEKAGRQDCGEQNMWQRQSLSGRAKISRKIREEERLGHFWGKSRQQKT